MQPDERRTWDPGGGLPRSDKANRHLSNLICTACIATVNEEDECMTNGYNKIDSRTELDSHANMPVVGRNALIIADTGNKVEVNPYTPAYEAMTVPLVDAALQYDCPYTGQSYILIVRNALSVPSMSNNLLPPFVLREAGIQANDVPKIHKDDPSVEDHSIYFKETGFRIPLSLWGVFSYFPTIKPTVEECDTNEEIYMLTPNRWNPHSDVYARNEESMLDWEGNLADTRDRTRFVLSDVTADETLQRSVQVSAVESEYIDALMDDGATGEVQSDPCPTVPMDADQVSSVMYNVSPLLSPHSLCHLLEDQAEDGRYKMSIGSTTTMHGSHLVDDDNESITEEEEQHDDTNAITKDVDDIEGIKVILSQILDKSVSGEIDLDEYMVSATHA